MNKWKCTCWPKERRRFIRAIKKANYDRNKAAKLLKLSRATFFRYAKQLDLVTDKNVKFRSRYDFK